MSRKTIIVCCASSMITSKIVAKKIIQLAKNHRLEKPNIIQCKYDEVNQKMREKSVDCIIPTSPFSMEVEQSVKVILGTSLVTDCDNLETQDDILVMLKS